MAHQAAGRRPPLAPALATTAIPTREFISLHRAVQATKLSRYAVMQAAIGGRVRVVVSPGQTPRYHAGDCAELARQRRTVAAATDRAKAIGFTEPPPERIP